MVIAIIATLAALLLPALGRTKESGRATVCLSNLHQVGLALQLYVSDNNNRLPVMADMMIPSPATNAFLRHSMVSRAQLGNTTSALPFRPRQTLRSTGSSYSWNTLSTVKMLIICDVGLPILITKFPLFFDKEDFHKARGANKAVNYLYADGHIKTSSPGKKQFYGC